MVKKQIATFLGPNKGLSIAGDYAYAYSGVVSDSSSGSAATTALNFTSGNYIVVGELNMITNDVLNNQHYVDVIFNGESIFKGSWDAEPYAITGPLTSLIIPPRTVVIVKWGSSAAKDATIVITGRVYNA